MTDPGHLPQPVERLLRESSQPRAVAAGILAQWLVTGDFPDRLVDAVTHDRGVIMEMVYGSVRRRRSLEWCMQAMVQRRTPEAAQACLLVGAYQLLFMDSVAAHAAVHETVSVAKRAGGPRLAGFVNHVLRRVSERVSQLKSDLARAPLGIRESFPDPLVDRWEKRLGPERAARLCRWNNERPRVIIRINRARTTLADMQARLTQAQVEAAPHPFRPETCLTLSSGVAVPALPGFAEGLWMVQDPSTLLSVEWLDPQPGQRVLDACAAPGGKTILIGEALQGRGTLVAMDVHEDRLAPLRANLARMQVAAEVVLADARDPALDSALGTERFDRILIDAPCTNTGVLRRRPDARWRYTVPRMKALARTQGGLLENLAPRLKPGGLLVYSTCSLEPEEDGEVVSAWLGRHGDFELLRSESLFPPETETDGAFAALIRRKG